MAHMQMEEFSLLNFIFSRYIVGHSALFLYSIAFCSDRVSDKVNFHIVEFLMLNLIAGIV